MGPNGIKPKENDSYPSQDYSRDASAITVQLRVEKERSEGGSFRGFSKHCLWAED